MSWTAPEVDRAVAPLGLFTGDERALADAWLDFNRQTLLWKCGGLSEEQLKARPLGPSRLSLLGLVRHLAEVERDWFRTRFGGAADGYLYCTDADQTAEFEVAAADAAADFAAYHREIELVREQTRGHSLDETYLDPRRGEPISLRWVYDAMNHEYARHIGHADLLRERIDGRTGH
jgi:uncharacterized damage-inducible protein DinB